MVAGEIVQDYKCENCEKKVEIKRCSTIKRLPNTLIVHLQRLVFDFDTMMQKKLNDRVEFPNVLNVKDFMLEEVLKDIKKSQDNDENNLP
jgi:ubiquitin carboxyl-terminal hydrolase 34